MGYISKKVAAYGQFVLVCIAVVKLACTAEKASSQLIDRSYNNK